MDEPIAQVSRRRLVVALGVTLVVLPLLLFGGFGLGSDDSPPVESAAPSTTAAPPPPKGVSIAPTEIDLSLLDPNQVPADPAGETGESTTPTTRSIEPDEPVEVRDVPTGPDETTPPPPPTQREATFDEGQASWADLGDRTCAHRTIAFDTVIRVTNTATGASTTCTVTARGPYVAGRIVELDRAVFEDIGRTNAGTVTVRIEW